MLSDTDYLRPGEIVFARTGASVGKTYLYRDDERDTVFAGFLIRAILREENNPEFVYQQTLSEPYKNYVAITSQRSGQPGINAQEYSEWDLWTCGKDEQDQIGSFFRSLDSLIALHQREYLILLDLSTVVYIPYVSDSDTNKVVIMLRTISESLSPILEDLELDRPQLVSLADLRAMCERHRIGTEPRVVASRLKQKGWLVATPQRGVWEFAPAELAGSYSSADPLLALKAFNIAHPESRNALRGQSAAWALGLADRAPSTISVAFEERPKVKIPPDLAPVTFMPRNPVRFTRGVNVLGPASIVTQMAERPSSVRSWQSAAEWLPDVAFEVDERELLKELEGRPSSVAQRTGYLLQGMRPDLAAAVADTYATQAVAKMGTSEAPIRYDQKWMVSDALLPFDPRELEAVK